MGAYPDHAPGTCPNPDSGRRPDLVREHRAETSEGSQGFLPSSHPLLLNSHRHNALVAAMKRAEILSRVFISAGVLLAIGVPLILWQRTPLIHVSMAEEGGWIPNTLKAEVGIPLELHLISDDVMH